MQIQKFSYFGFRDARYIYIIQCYFRVTFNIFLYIVLNLKMDGWIDGWMVEYILGCLDIWMYG